MTAGQKVVKMYLEHLLDNNKIVEETFGEAVAVLQFDKSLDSILELIDRYKGTYDSTQPAFFTLREAVQFLGDRGFIIINGNNAYKPDLNKVTGFVISESDISKLERFIKTQVTTDLEKTTT